MKKKVYSEHEKFCTIGVFREMFYGGPKAVIDMLEARFHNKDLKENYDDDTKGFFIKAAQDLFQGKTDVDKITIKELAELFKNNKTLLELQQQFSGEEFKIEFLKEYSNKGLEGRFFKLFLEVDKQKLKDFIALRFKNNNQDKNLTIEEQKICLMCAQSVINGVRKKSTIEKKDIKEFKEIFNTDDTLKKLQETLDIDLSGVESEDSSSEE